MQERSKKRQNIVWIIKECIQPERNHESTEGADKLARLKARNVSNAKTAKKYRREANQIAEETAEQMLKRQQKKQLKVPKPRLESQRRKENISRKWKQRKTLQQTRCS
jgi:hypothetical protein